MEEKTQSQAFLGTEPVGKLLFRLALPAIAAQLINVLYNIVDRVYLGHTLLGKSRKVSVKSKKKVKVPEEEWVFTKNTHEALVSQEQFDMAAHFMGENTKANGANPAFRHSIFGGIACCACCGAAMCSGGSVYNGERAKYWYLVCNNLSSRTQTRCMHGARIRYDDLMEVVRCDLNKLLSFDESTIALSRRTPSSRPTPLWAAKTPSCRSRTSTSRPPASRR